MFIQDGNFGHDAVILCRRVDGVHNSVDRIHRFCEIEMVLEGEIEITVSGKTRVARAGDLAVIPPLKVHSFNTPDQVKMLIFVVSGFFLPASVSTEELLAEREGYVFPASTALWNYLCEVGLYHTRSRKSFDHVADYELIHRLRATVHLILAEFLSYMQPVGDCVGSGTFAKILLYLSEHFTEDVTLATVGNALGYSPKYVSNCFAEMPGMSFRFFVNALRIEEAKARLSGTDDNVLAISIDCGFKNESSFHRVFREMTGTTPAQYRARKRGQ